jgi:hypothetical protein
MNRNVTILNATKPKTKIQKARSVARNEDKVIAVPAVKVSV